MDATEATRSEAKARRLNLVSNGANHRQLIDVGSTSLPVSKATTADQKFGYLLWYDPTEYAVTPPHLLRSAPAEDMITATQASYLMPCPCV
jgi:hypothetical protein